MSTLNKCNTCEFSEYTTKEGSPNIYFHSCTNHLSEKVSDEFLKSIPKDSTNKFGIIWDEKERICTQYKPHTES